MGQAVRSGCRVVRGPVCVCVVISWRPGEYPAVWSQAFAAMLSEHHIQLTHARANVTRGVVAAVL